MLLIKRKTPVNTEVLVAGGVGEISNFDLVKDMVKVIGYLAGIV